MTLRHRRILFYSLVLVFVFAGVGAALYAQGWRLDWGTFAANKVGAIYVRTAPTDADIFLNDKPIRRTFSFFQTGALVNDLFPKDYRLTITKDGYEPWRRRLTVKPAVVATAKYAVLIPKNSTIANPGPASDFRIIRNEIARVAPEGKIIWRDRTLPGNKIIGATDDGNRLLSLDEAKHQYFWNDLAAPTSTALAPIVAKTGLTAAERKAATLLVDPPDSSRVFIRLPRTLLRLDLQSGRLTTLGTASSTKTIGEISSSRNRTAWITFHETEQSSELFVYVNSRNVLEETGIPPIAGRTVKLEWLPNGLLAILQNNGTLYLYDPGRRDLSPRANDVKDFVAATSGEFLAALENRSLEIFSLTSTDYWRFNLPSIDTVRKLSWYADHQHLFVHYPDRVALLDFEDTSLETFQTAAATSKAEYDLNENALYFLNDERVMKLVFPGR
ncbi:MAG: hypothetical protein AAB867_00625 [Patescibacteria group bacterium]